MSLIEAGNAELSSGQRMVLKDVYHVFESRVSLLSLSDLGWKANPNYAPVKAWNFVDDNHTSSKRSDAQVEPVRDLGIASTRTVTFPAATTDIPHKV